MRSTPAPCSRTPRPPAYLAGAALQHELTRRLGVRWRRIRSGIAEVDGVPRAAIEALSSRRHQIDTIAHDLGVTSPEGRQAIAQRSRPTKQPQDLNQIRREWRMTLARTGFDQRALRRCLGQTSPRSLSDDEKRRLYQGLARYDGLTATASTFDRRDTIQAIADRTTGRLQANEIQQLADSFLARPGVIELHPQRRQPAPNGPSLRTASAANDAATGPRYTTQTMLRAESNILQRFRDGIHAQIAVVPPETISDAIDTEPALGTDQRQAIQKLCRDGHQLQGLVGPAGTGKTFTLRVAARAWQAAGYRVLGAAVQGTAAENLERCHRHPQPNRRRSARPSRPRHTR